MWAHSHPSHTCELLGEAEAAGVLFERAVHEQGAIQPLSAGTRTHARVSALTGFPPKLCESQLGVEGSWGMASALAYQPGEGLPCPALLNTAACQRSKLGAKCDGERRSCSCAVLQQQIVDEAVKPQVILQSAQLSVAGEEWQGHSKQEDFQNCVRALRVPPALSWLQSWESTCQPAGESWGCRLLAGLHLHNLWR